MKDDEIPHRLKGVLEGFKQRGASVLNIFVPDEKTANQVVQHARRMGLGARGIMTSFKAGAHWALFAGDNVMYFVEVTQS